MYAKPDQSKVAIIHRSDIANTFLSVLEDTKPCITQPWSFSFEFWSQLHRFPLPNSDYTRSIAYLSYKHQVWPDPAKVAIES